MFQNKFKEMNKKLSQENQILCKRWRLQEQQQRYKNLWLWMGKKNTCFHTNSKSNYGETREEATEMKKKLLPLTTVKFRVWMMKSRETRRSWVIVPQCIEPLIPILNLICEWNENKLTCRTKPSICLELVYFV